MFSKADLFTDGLVRGPWRAAGRLAAPLAAACAAAALAACGAVPSLQNAREDNLRAEAVRAAAAASSTCPVPAPSLPPVCNLPSPADATARMLAYADRVRLIAPADLAQEVARLGEVNEPTGQVQLALVLSQQRTLPELIRAQELLARVLGNPSLEAQALHPLARLLASRYGEQRRAEEQLEKQNQQVRDVQRRLDQTNERLEALKAIERSLSSRLPAGAASSPAAPAAPASRGRPGAP